MPSLTTEGEIFGVLADNLKIAAEKCRLLAWHPKRGWIYDDFRKALKLVEGACRQVYYWRDYDSRWLVLGRLCSFAHEGAGRWMRDSPTAGRRKLAHPEFQKLADILTQMSADNERLKTAATGRRGPIMPVELPGPHRDTRPVSIILPPGFRDRRVA